MVGCDLDCMYGTKGRLLVHCDRAGCALRYRALFRFFTTSNRRGQAVPDLALFMGRHSGLRVNLAGL